MTRNKRDAYQAAVFTARLPDSVKVMLLRMLIDMDSGLIVSIPRTKLAADLNVPLARITERVKVAKQRGYLEQVRRGRPGVTAVYRGIPRGTESVPLEVRHPVPSVGTDSVPPRGTPRPHPSSGPLSDSRNSRPTVTHGDEERQDEQVPNRADSRPADWEGDRWSA